MKGGQAKPGPVRLCLTVFCCLFLGAGFYACAPALIPSGTVVLYTSVDQPFAEPILKQFEQASGIEVQAVYDVEAAKTTGLVNRLIAEKDSPRADVFWNSEIIQTILLQEEAVLDAYQSPNAAAIPATCREPQGYWTGVTARARVLIVNVERVPHPEALDSLDDLLDPAWLGEEVGIAYPLFGTTATHAAALYQVLGAEEARDYFQQLADRGVRVVDGNSVVRDLVVSGQLAFGLTDSDDACVALRRGAPIAINPVGQGDLGILVIPSTVALVAGAPHPAEGRALIDYLLTHEVEQALLDADFGHIPLHEGLESAEPCLSTAGIRIMDVDYVQVYRHFEAVKEDMREVFLR
jgi:iron(III) transport system substrate-binding protein